ncbi:hypothetical protein SDC9_60269 [bioreactor metagenome]|uniref:N-acetyltransferase domain-containing protein n=1 Tax=bioreactor metagenome TaxID=1076179 RepID=A0A644XCT3_9ZZZZ
MKFKILRDKNSVPDVVKIHIQTFKGFFLTFLGEGFLNQLYSGFLEHKNSNILVAVDEDNNVIGFLAYSENMSEFYKFLIKSRLVKFAWYSLIAFFRNPCIAFRLLRAFLYSKSAERAEKYVELSSIGILPERKKQGTGTGLIKTLITMIDSSEFEYIKLETDKYNNDSVNAFYLNCGFELDNSYNTAEGRAMNEYKLYLKEL